MMDFHKNVNISIFSYVFKGIFSLDHWKAIVHRKFKGKIYEEMSELYNQRYRLESPVKTNISFLATKFKQTGSMSVCIIINIWWQNSEHKWRCWKESEFFDSSSPTLTWTFSKTLFDMHYVFPESVLHPATVSDSKKKLYASFGNEHTLLSEEHFILWQKDGFTMGFTYCHSPNQLIFDASQDFI